MTWLSASTYRDLLRARSPLGGQADALRAEAAAGTPGRTASIINARVDQLMSGEGSLASFGALSPAEQAVVDVTDQFLLDAHSISDSMVASLGEHYSSTEQVSLLFHLAMADGFTKFARVFGVVSDHHGDQPEGDS